MPITNTTIQQVRIEIQRYQAAELAYRVAYGRQATYGSGGPPRVPRETGALRRASLDLSHALVELRRPHRAQTLPEARGLEAQGPKAQKGA